MSDTKTSPSGPGWYPEPSGRGGKAWWNGTSWGPSEYVPAGGHATQQLIAPSSAAAPQYTHAMSASSSDISPYTWQLWLLVLLPLVPALAMTLIDPTTIFLSAFDPLVAYSDPAYVVAIVGSWVVFFATIFLAFADVRSLKRRGLESPFHPAFILLGALIYVIGRSVVVKRETGAGLTPIWATLGVWLASGAASMIMAFNATGFLGF